MLRTYHLAGGLIAFAAILFIVGCSNSESAKQVAKPGAKAEHPHGHSHSGDSTNRDEDHAHGKGSHGGVIVSLGRDSYHVEAIVTKSGELQLYMLGSDESRVIDIETQDLVAHLKTTGSDIIQVKMKPQPQSGDSEGKASLFVGQLPETLAGQVMEVTVPSIRIGDERFRLNFPTKWDDQGTGGKSDKAVSEAERQLYLTPGGIYTQADIEANGNLTASQKFANFEPSHDLKPNIGDKICPITLTKANPKCTWQVGGKIYEFCCPPCVSEFVALAKTNPEEVKSPEEYVKG